MIVYCTRESLYIKQSSINQLSIIFYLNITYCFFCTSWFFWTFGDSIMTFSSPSIQNDKQLSRATVGDLTHGSPESKQENNTEGTITKPDTNCWHVVENLLSRWVCVCEVRLHVRAGVPRSCSSCQEHKSESFVPEGCKCNRAHLLEHLTQSEEADDKQICVMCNMRAGHGLMWEDGGSVVRPVGPVTGTLFLCADSDKKECCTKINRGYGSGVTQTRLCLCVSVCQEAVAIKQALELFLSDLSVKGIWNYKIQPLGGGIVCATLIMFGICQQQVHYVSAPTCLATSLWRHVRYYMFRAISFCIVKPVGVFSRSYVVFCAYWFGSNTACNSA